MFFSSWFWRIQNHKKKKKKKGGATVRERKNKDQPPSVSYKRRVCIHVFCILLWVIISIVGYIERFGCNGALGSK